MIPTTSLDNICCFPSRITIYILSKLLEDKKPQFWNLNIKKKLKIQIKLDMSNSYIISWFVMSDKFICNLMISINREIENITLNKSLWVRYAIDSYPLHIYLNTIMRMKAEAYLSLPFENSWRLLGMWSSNCKVPYGSLNLLW